MTVYIVISRERGSDENADIDGVYSDQAAAVTRLEQARKEFPWLYWEVEPWDVKKGQTSC